VSAAATIVSPLDLVQGQLEAYNAQDVERFVSFFAPNAVLAGLNGPVTTEGLAAIRVRHETLFTQHPQNRATLLHRIVLGNVVIDHEDVLRAPGGERFQVAAIYTIKDGLIARVDYVR
jgi:uncharacterized protein (TIGR02246 family)